MTAQPVNLEEIKSALQRVPPDRLPEVLTFIEFLEYQAEHENESRAMDDIEDAALWTAVETDDTYKVAHPSEMIIHESGADFLAATEDR